MKILSYLFLALSICLFASCGSDDSIEGKWALVSFTYSDCVDPDDNEVESGYSTTPCTATSQDDCYYQEFDFLSDGNISITALETFGGELDEDTFTSTYTIDGDMITICDGGICENGTYSIDGNNLTIDLDDVDECTLIIRMRKV